VDVEQHRDVVGAAAVIIVSSASREFAMRTEG
jgi:hypothetical protein